MDAAPLGLLREPPQESNVARLTDDSRRDAALVMEVRGPCSSAVLSGTRQRSGRASTSCLDQGPSVLEEIEFKIQEEFGHRGHPRAGRVPLASEKGLQVRLAFAGGQQRPD